MSRSSPMPVSTCREGSARSEPSACRSNWMNTRFQTSITSGSPVFTSFAASRPPMRSKWISEHGPHGPVSPISQKLSLNDPGSTRSAGR